MTAISSSAEAQLFIGASTANPLPAPGSDTFVKVPQLKVVRPPQPSKSASKEVTLDGVTIASSSIASWSNCTGALLSNYTQAPHLTMLADAAITGRRRNFYIIEPDAGGRRTDFVGEVIRCEGGDYEAQEDAPPARRHEFEIAVSGTPTVTG